MIQKAIDDLGFVLPRINPKAHLFKPYIKSADTIEIIGQPSMRDGKLMYKGIFGQDVMLGEGQDAVRLCVLNLFSHLNHALEGNLDRILSCSKMGIWVSGDDDTLHKGLLLAIDGLMLQIMGHDKYKTSAIVLDKINFNDQELITMDARFNYA